MRKFYYLCPRCGRRWARYIPRSKMSCPFCSERWNTRGRRGSRSRFSWTATFLWLFWISLIALAFYKGCEFVEVVSRSFDKPGIQKEKNEAGKAPPIRFRTLKEIEDEKNEEVKAEANVQNSDSVAEPDVVQSVDDAEQEKTPELEPDL